MNLLPASFPETLDDVPARPRLRRPWREKFRDAFRGLKLGIRGHSSFSVHFFFAALVVAAAIVLGCNAGQWAILVGCVGAVLAAELFNSAIETLFRGLEEATKARTYGALDVSAGAVLLVSVFASIIGSIVFVQKLIDLFKAPGSPG
jgi:diacylglycerol kinase